MLLGTKVTLYDGTNYRLKHYVNCKTPGIVYLMVCLCGCYYVGNTKRPFWLRVPDHIYMILEIRIPTHQWKEHIVQYHKQNLRSMKFFYIGHLHSDIRGGDIDAHLLQIEARWINRLKALDPSGLNESPSFKSFLPK